MKSCKEINNAEWVIRKLSDFRELSLKFARVGLDAGLFQYPKQANGPPPPAEYVILAHAVCFVLPTLIRK